MRYYSIYIKMAKTNQSTKQNKTESVSVVDRLAGTLYYVLSELSNGTTTLKNYLLISYKIIYTFIQ